MSFSGEVKDELAKQFCQSRHCQLAELAALIHFAGKITAGEGRGRLAVVTEHASIARKCYTLIKDAFSYAPGIMQQGNYSVIVEEEEHVLRILKAVKLLEVNGMASRTPNLVDERLIRRSCCMRAYIRGAFLASGSMSDPQKSYHLEIVCSDRVQANQLRDIMRIFVPDTKVVQRKKYFICYIKEGAQIVDALNVMGAYSALMNLENVRIVKEMRNSVNRKVNCETANINKTVSAAVRQLEDIRLIQELRGLSSLSDNLQQVAGLRLKYPDMPLKELGEALDPPVGKSGVNHRFRKISEIAEQLRRSNYD